MLDKLGNYRIYEPILEREPGPVYRGMEISKEMEVAVQLLHPHLTEEEETRNACARESKSLSSLTHPNIARFHEFFLEGERCVYIYELLHGKTLDQTISENEGPLGFAAAFRLMAPVLSALDFAHNQGVLHGGIRPANVMIADDGGDRVVKLLSFGIAMGLHGGKGSKYIGARMDSFCYLAPEQLEEEGKIDERADIYSAAVLLYELVTGTAPYRFDSLEKFSQNMSMRLLPPTPRSINPELPKELEEVILKGLSPDRGERFQSARAFLEALEALDGGKHFEGADLTSGVDETKAETSGPRAAPPAQKPGPKRGAGGIATPPVASASPVVDKSFHDAVEKIRQREREKLGPGVTGAPSIRPGPSKESRNGNTTAKGTIPVPPVIPSPTVPSASTDQKPPAAATGGAAENKRKPLARLVVVLIVITAMTFLFLKFRSPEEEKSTETTEEKNIETIEEETSPGQEVALVATMAAPEGMVLVPGGTFQAGNDDIEGSPAHQATLSPFFADILQQPGNVSWYEALEACSHRGLRLPTEHEWELAVRMGLIEIGPNADWVQDWYGGDVYGKSSGLNPSGPPRIECVEDPGDWQKMRERLGIDERCCKVLRGFVWGGCKDSVTCRSYWGPDQAYKNRAFRCVKELEPEP